MSAIRHPPFSPAFDIELLLQHILFWSFAEGQNDTDAPSTAPVATATRGHAFSPPATAVYLERTPSKPGFNGVKTPIRQLAKVLTEELDPAPLVLNC